MRVYITARLIKSEFSTEVYDAYDTAWRHFFNTSGLELNWLPTGWKFESKSDWKSTDLVVFSGGNNLVQVEDSKINRLREDYESRLYRFLKDQFIPVLGVCKGTQLIHRLEGGSPLVPLNGHAGCSHNLIWKQAHQLENIQNIVSHHEYAIPNSGVPDSLDVIATDEAEHPEVVHVKDHPIYGLMWHPERQEGATQAATLEWIWRWIHEH